MTIKKEILSINATAHKERWMYYLDSYESTYKNIHELLNWVIECGKKTHLHVEICHSDRYYDDAPLILFAWDDNIVERIEIPRIFLLVKLTD